jgi:hypothetical protein
LQRSARVTARIVDLDGTVLGHSYVTSVCRVQRSRSATVLPRPERDCQTAGLRTRPRAVRCRARRRREARDFLAQSFVERRWRGLQLRRLDDLIVIAAGCGDCNERCKIPGIGVI